MSNILILNGSPRAPKSNSKRYAEIFRESCGVETQYYNISAKNHAELCDKFDDFSDVLLVFPLYADAIPVTLLNFLKSLEVMPPEKSRRYQCLSTAALSNTIRMTSHSRW